MSRKVILFFLACVLIHLLLFLVKNYSPILKRPDGLEQENFVVYIEAIRSGKFPAGLAFADTRFFPGLPLLIFGVSKIIGSVVISGMGVSLICLSLIYFTGVKITKNPLYSLFITVFPPIVFEQTSKISTETVMIFLSLIIYLLFSKKKYMLASFLAGLATIVRPVGFFLYIAIAVTLLKDKKIKDILRSLLMYLILPIFLLLFNYYYFGDILYQIQVNSMIGEASFSLIQTFRDVYINFLKGEWRIIISGLIYVFFSIFLLIKTIRNKFDFIFEDDNLFIKIWFLGTFIFIFSVGPAQFLAEVRRFLAVVFPLALTVNYEYFSKYTLFMAFGLLIMVVAFV